MIFCLGDTEFFSVGRKSNNKHANISPIDVQLLVLQEV